LVASLSFSLSNIIADSHTTFNKDNYKTE